MNLEKTENTTPKERRKRMQRKKVPLEGQMKISMFLRKDEKNGEITPNSGKRKYIDDIYDFNSKNTPEKKKKNTDLEGNRSKQTGV